MKKTSNAFMGYGTASSKMMPPMMSGGRSIPIKTPMSMNMPMSSMPMSSMSMGMKMAAALGKLAANVSSAELKSK